MNLRKKIIIFKYEKIVIKKKLILNIFILEREYILTESHVKENALILEWEKLEMKQKRMKIEHDRFLIEYEKSLYIPRDANEIV